MALMMDLPVCRTKEMTELDLLLLTDYVIPRKIVQSAIYFLLVWNLDREQTLSVKRLLEEAGKENQPSVKQAWKEHDNQGEIDIMDYYNDDEYVPNVGPSQKATKGDDAGV